MTTLALSSQEMCNIIARLPKTADMVPVVPQVDSVFHPEDCTLSAPNSMDILCAKRRVLKCPQKYRKRRELGIWVAYILISKHQSFVGVHECYSTYELAYKASKKYHG